LKVNYLNPESYKKEDKEEEKIIEIEIYNKILSLK
jgi:hypothetical protein